MMMTTTRRKMQVVVDGAREESFHKQQQQQHSVVAIQNNALYSKSTTAFDAIPQLIDNPLFERSSQENGIPVPGNLYYSLNVQAESLEEHRRRRPLARLSLDRPAEAGAKAARKMQSLSLSSRDYEGMWRTAQENALRSTRDSISALEDFKQFRQKLADLKLQTRNRQEETTPALPSVLTPSGSIRSLNVGSASTRSLSLSPSTPTSPLKRLSVLTSRKAVSALNPERESQRGRGGAALPPSVQKFALSMRAEGLFKIPNPATISPVSSESDQHSSPPRQQQVQLPQVPRPDDSVTNPSPVKAPKRRFFVRGRTPDSNERKDSAKATALGTPRTADAFSMAGSRKLAKTVRAPKYSAGSAACSIDETFMASCSPRLAALSSPRALRNAAPQQQQQLSQTQVSKRSQVEKLTIPSCGPRASDLKLRCIPIPRPMCYGGHILE